MSIQHHPDDATIIAYAAGTLDEAFAVLVSCHLETCPHCRETLRMAEMIGGAMLDEQEEAPIAEGAYGRVLEKISAGESSPGGSGMNQSPKRSSSTDWHRMPRALESYLDKPIDAIDWKRVGPGVWQRPIVLSHTAQSSLRLLRIAPGKSVPEHGHGGQEMTLILSGAYRDEIGHFGAGDVADLDDHIEHQPRVISDEDCICLAATEAPTRFKSLASRLMQPLIGI